MPWEGVIVGCIAQPLLCYRKREEDCMLVGFPLQGLAARCVLVVVLLTASLCIQDERRDGVDDRMPLDNRNWSTRSAYSSGGTQRGSGSLQGSLNGQPRLDSKRRSSSYGRVSPCALAFGQDPSGSLPLAWFMCSFLSSSASV